MINGSVAGPRLQKLLKEFHNKRILVLGDLMLDQFVRGKVSRLSPEAPVPVVQVTSESQVPGGAGNVCSNLASLGASVSAASLVGNDEAGRLLLALLRNNGINTESVLLAPDRPTTQKCRIIADHQQVVRYDRETVGPTARKEQDALIKAIQAEIPRCQGVIISDYGKGVVTPPVLQAAIRSAKKAGVPVTVDPKIEHFRRYKGVDCITPNLHEAWTGMRLIAKPGQASVEELGRRILRALQPETVLITQGGEGMTLFENRSPVRSTHIAAQAREVYDVTGAGDTVISVFTLALAAGATYQEAAVIANRAAGIVVGKLGTATVSVQELGNGRR
ncbi:MAG: D-glycero-beta-D-manno-heptose-7-phosphate kinase [Elusimicrobia bacterium]|nr:D-glycero-beta-D-manno-heptose-7-phosphate kinase [Elusimicrobiota bacterium]